MDPIQGLDHGTYYWFRQQRKEGQPILQPVMELANELGSYLVLAVFALVALGLLLVRRRYRAAGIFAACVASAVLVGEGLRFLVKRPRPHDADDWLNDLSAGFPSISALLSSLVFLVLALIVGTILPRRGLRLLVYIACIVLVLLIGTSQIYLGLNFLTDVLAGWTAGVLLVLVGDLFGSFSRADWP